MIASVVPYDQRNHAPDAESRRGYCVWSGQGWKDEVPATWSVRMDDGYTYAMCSGCLAHNLFRHEQELLIAPGLRQPAERTHQVRS
jgi:hypothetical protein